VKDNFEKCFQLVLEHEGGFVNNPKDPGGTTNFGVTQRAWEAWLVRTVTESDMRRLTPTVIKPFYRAMYWDKIKGDQLPNGVDYATFDLAVNSGVSRAAKWLQEIAGVPVDGIIGPKSLEAIRACDPKEVVDVLCDMRLDFLKRLSTFETFGKGWTSRVAEVKLQATGMA
jgi:lysozyme family protein